MPEITAHADVGDVRSRHSRAATARCRASACTPSGSSTPRASRTSSSSTGRPVAGTHSLVWDEAVKISGADPDFHRRDLWEAIEAGAYPGVRAGRADLHRGAGRGLHLRRARRDQDRARGAGAGDPGRQARAEPQPGQLLRRDRAGRVLRRARRAGHRLLQRSAARRPHPLLRRHADLAARRRRTSTRSRSTRRSRRCTTTSATACTARRSTAAASPTSRTRSAAAVRSRPATDGLRVVSPSRAQADDHKVRGKPERFADHYTQATLFWNSQTPVEKTHIVNAFRFELSRVQTPAIRERMVSGLMNVAPELAEAVAEGLGHARAAGADAEGARPTTVTPEVTASPALSLFARPGDGGIRDAARRHPGRRRRATARPSQALAERLRRRGRGAAVRRPDARRGRGAVAASRSRSTCRSKRRRRSSTTPSSSPTAQRRRTRSPPTAGARVPQGPVPALQADPRASAPAPSVLRHGRHPATRCPTATPTPACSSARPASAIVDAFLERAGEAPPLRRAKPIRRASDARAIRLRTDYKGATTMAEAGTLHDAFIDELRDTYDAEKQLTKALPKLAKAATSPELRQAFADPSRGDAGPDRAARRGVREPRREGRAASTATASPASSRKASRSWRRTSTRRRWTPA